MIKIERVAETNWSKLVQLFSGSLECSECWCMNHRSDPMSRPTGELAKAALGEALGVGKAYGLLALVDGAPAGWCAVDPVRTQIGHDYCIQTKQCESSAAWMIHCLYIDPRHRGTGLSRALIDAAIDLATANGASELLAFPIPEESNGKFPEDIAEFSGRLSTYRKKGFQAQTRLDDFYQVVSKPL